MTHPAGEQFAAYWLGELDEAAVEVLEEHLFACEPCTDVCSRTRLVIEGVRAMLPPVITSARVAELHATVPALKRVDVAPGASATVDFGAGEHLYLLDLQADLAGVERVDFTMELPDGTTLLTVPDAPFDARAGVVHVLCQRHFVEHDFELILRTPVNMRLRATRQGQAAELGLYSVAHVISA